LARASGYGARVVLGAAIIVDDTSSGAFGHAWSEIYDGGQWLTSDAALAEIAQAVHYIRAGVLENESMSFRLSLLGLMDSVSIHHLVLSNEKK
jgi:transglutaminase-like putative cysteine protease